LRNKDVQNHGQEVDFDSFELKMPKINFFGIFCWFVVFWLSARCWRAAEPWFNLLLILVWYIVR
jgi:hypothetical protein